MNVNEWLQSDELVVSRQACAVRKHADLLLARILLLPVHALGNRWTHPKTRKSIDGKTYARVTVENDSNHCERIKLRSTAGTMLDTFHQLVMQLSSSLPQLKRIRFKQNLSGTHVIQYRQHDHL